MDSIWLSHLGLGCSCSPVGLASESAATQETEADKNSGLTFNAFLALQQKLICFGSAKKLMFWALFFPEYLFSSLYFMANCWHSCITENSKDRILQQWLQVCSDLISRKNQLISLAVLGASCCCVTAYCWTFNAEDILPDRLGREAGGLEVERKIG